MQPNPQERSAIAYLRTPAAIRERCQQLFTLARHHHTRHFGYDSEQLHRCAAYVASVIRQTYPTLDIPWHSRWRHFHTGGVDRLAEFQQLLAGVEVDERARIAVDLVIISVLLDAGAGEHWRFHDRATGQTLTRSEGLAIASWRMFLAGQFSSHASSPWQADAAGLQRITEATLAAALQVTATNPLVGLAGRASLLRQLGAVVAQSPQYFGSTAPRLGHLYDYCRAQAVQGVLPARHILQVLLDSLSPIWPGGLRVGSVAMGDVWRHSQVRGEGLTAGLVPFHKLSQWLTYSLIEPLQTAGLTVSDVEALTALAEYRNGGLLVDLGVLRPQYPGVVEDVHTPDSEVVVEWRALTIALLDELAPLVCQQLGCTPQSLPLAKLLEGGTWRAGRQIARELRASGAPPIRVASDGTVF